MKYLFYDHGKPEINIYPFSDWHLGAKQCNVDFLKRLVRRVKNDPIGVWIYLGDGGETVTKQSKGSLYEQTLSPGDQLRAFAKLTDSVKDKGLFGICGNHGRRIDNEVGIGWDELLCAKVGIPYAGAAGFLGIQLEDASGHRTTVNLYAHHGAGGGTSQASKMKTAAKPLEYVVADIVLTGHCFDDATELLTPSGWKSRTDFKVGDPIISWNKDTRSLEVDKVNEVHTYTDYKELYRIQNRNIDLLVTDKHGLIDVDNLSKPKYFEARDFSTLCDRTFMCASSMDRKGIDYTRDEIRLIVWIAADAHLVKDSKDRVEFHFTKERKVKTVEELLDRLNIDYTSSFYEKRGDTKIRFKLPQRIENLFDRNNKRLPAIIGECSEEQAITVLAAYSESDGYRSGKNSYQISTAKKEEADLLQALFVTSNLRCNVRCGRFGTYTVAVNIEHSTSSLITSNALSIEEYKGFVWCVSVNNGTVVARRNGKVCITQNTHGCGEVWPPKVFAQLDNKNKRIKWQHCRAFACGSGYDSRSGYAEEMGYPPTLPEQLCLNIKQVTRSKNKKATLGIDTQCEVIRDHPDISMEHELAKWTGKDNDIEFF